MSYKKLKRLSDSVHIGEWKEVEALPLSAVTSKVDDVETLDGLIVKGYETKFDTVNENNERYTRGALDKFIEHYFVANEFNIPVDIQHRDDIEHLCGRVLLVEVTDEGYYFVGYIPKTFKNYDTLVGLLRNGILQGFSKFGYATDWHVDEEGVFMIDEFKLLSVSIVATPANPVPFDEVGTTIQNRVEFRKGSNYKLKSFFNKSN